jgi:enoyl-CoA hydratase
MEFKNLTTRKSDGIGWITVNRPDKLNALNVETVEELRVAFEEYHNDAEVKAVILTGAGEKAFIAGADISEFVHLDAEKGKHYALKGQELTKFIESFRKPVIAAINGFALGGGTEFALACHIRLASENARMGQPEVKLGLIPGFGGTQRLSRLVGKGKAMELILSGKVIDAKEAYEIGLVNKIIPAKDLLSEAEVLAKEIIKNAPLALEFAIRAINKGLDQTLDAGLRLEAEIFGRACSTEDSREGAKAFLEKRKPNFRGQ